MIALLAGGVAMGHTLIHAQTQQASQSTVEQQSLQMHSKLMMHSRQTQASLSKVNANTQTKKATTALGSLDNDSNTSTPSNWSRSSQQSNDVNSSKNENKDIAHNDKTTKKVRPAKRARKYEPSYSDVLQTGQQVTDTFKFMYNNQLICQVQSQGTYDPNADSDGGMTNYSDIYVDPNKLSGYYNTNRDSDNAQSFMYRGGTHYITLEPNSDVSTINVIYTYRGQQKGEYSVHGHPYSSVTDDIEQDIASHAPSGYNINPIIDEEFGQKEKNIIVTLTNINPNSQSQSSNNHDNYDPYYSITVNYKDNSTGQIVGNSYTEDGNSDTDDVGFNILNDTMMHVPSGYHYLYMQRPILDHMPTNQNIIANVSKDENKSNLTAQPIYIQTVPSSSVTAPHSSASVPMSSSTSQSTSSFRPSTNNIQPSYHKHIPSIKNLDYVKFGKGVLYHGIRITKQNAKRYYGYLNIIKPVLAHTTLDSIGTAKHYAFVISPQSTNPLNIKNVWTLQKDQNKNFLRYEINLHGKTYFITGNSNYVNNAYYQPSKRISNKARVLKPSYDYKFVGHKRKYIKHYHKGQTIHIKRIININKLGMSRAQLTNGHYITANKARIRLI